MRLGLYENQASLRQVPEVNDFMDDNAVSLRYGVAVSMRRDSEFLVLPTFTKTTLYLRFQCLSCHVLLSVKRPAEVPHSNDTATL